MTKTIKNEEKKDEEILEIEESEETEKKHENIPPSLMARYTKPTAFQQSGNFWKSNFQTNNNRQRPGRAAWRWR